MRALRIALKTEWFFANQIELLHPTSCRFFSNSIQCCADCMMQTTNSEGVASADGFPYDGIRWTSTYTSGAHNSDAINFEMEIKLDFNSTYVRIVESLCYAASKLELIFVNGSRLWQENWINIFSRISYLNIFAAIPTRSFDGYTSSVYTVENISIKLVPLCNVSLTSIDCTILDSMANFGPSLCVVTMRHKHICIHVILTASGSVDTISL